MLRSVGLIFVLFIASLCLAEETTLSPIDDMFTDCLATGTHLENQLYLNRETAFEDERVMFKFDVSSIITLESAIFHLHRFFSCPSGAGQTIARFYPIAEEWDEESWDCHTFPQYEVNNEILFTFDGPSNNQDTWYEIDLTSFVELWVYNILPNYGFVIIADMGQAHSKFDSKEAANIDLQPFLVVNGTLPNNEQSIIPSLTSNNYPNPFNPETVISFNIDYPEGNLTIFNTLGQIILRRNFPAGEYNFNWNAEKYSSGIYFYQIKSGNHTLTRKMSLIK